MSTPEITLFLYFGVLFSIQNGFERFIFHLFHIEHQSNKNNFTNRNQCIKMTFNNKLYTYTLRCLSS